MTIIEQPSGIVSAYSNQRIVVIDTAATSEGYIVAAVEYHNGDGHWFRLVGQSQKKYRNTNQFIFNLSEVLKQTVTYDIIENETSSAVKIDRMDSVSYCRIVLEHFEKVSNVYTSQSTGLSSTFTVTNVITDENLSEFTIVDGATKQFLTTNKRQKLRSGEHAQLAFLWDETQVSTTARVKEYPKAGGSTTGYGALDATDYEVAAFYGIDGATLTSSPSLTHSGGAVLAKVTAENGEEYVGLSQPNLAYSDITISAVGKKVRLHVFALAVGSGVRVVYVGGSGDDYPTMAVGWNTLTSTTIPASTTAIRIENRTGQQLLVAYVNILTPSYASFISNRGVIYLNEYDVTLSKVEVWMQNDAQRVSEIVTFDMVDTCAGKRLAWVNKLGGIEHYTFTDVSTGATEADRIKILSEAGVRNINTQSNDITTVFTFFENEETLQWLSEIITAPHVWLVENGNELTEVDVTSTNFPTNAKSLVQGSVSFRLAQFKDSQNG